MTQPFVPGSQGEPDPGPPAPVPDQLCQPGPFPLYAGVESMTDDQGHGWAALRLETVHGSHVTFLTPDLAEALAGHMIEAARRARIAIIGGSN